jgi:hypothetical protein
MTEVIVYRSPLEAALYNSGVLFPVLVGMFTMFVVSVVLLTVANRIDRARSRSGWNRSRLAKHYSSVALAVGFVAGCAATYLLII